MTYMSVFYERLEQLIDQAVKDSGMSKSRILIHSGIDPAHYRNYKKAERAFSEQMMRDLSSSGYVKVTLGELIAWKFIDEYGIDTVFDAIGEVRKIRQSQKDTQ